MFLFIFFILAAIFVILAACKLISMSGRLFAIVAKAIIAALALCVILGAIVPSPTRTPTETGDGVSHICSLN